MVVLSRGVKDGGALDPRDLLLNDPREQVAERLPAVLGRPAFFYALKKLPIG